MGGNQFYRDPERDLGILARVAPPGGDMTGFLIDDDTVASVIFLSEAVKAALNDAIPRMPGKWRGTVAITLAVNVALQIVVTAGWTSESMKRTALESLKATLCACADSHLRELGFEPWQVGAPDAEWNQ